MKESNNQLYSADLIKATINTIIDPLRSRNLSRINASIKQLQEESEDLVNNQFDKSEVKIDCKVNCTFCCHNQVSITSIEIILIVEYIKNNFSSEETTQLKDRINQLDKLTGNMNAFQRKKAKQPCALLVDNKCSVYPVRPLACKGWNSLNVQDCETAFNSDTESDIKTLIAPIVITNSVSLGISNSLKQVQLNSDVLELNAALKIALSKYNIGEKFLDSKNTFKDAKLKV